MNKRIFDIRIKAWLCALAILVLIIGFVFCGLIYPKIVGFIIIILFIIGLSLVLYAFAIWFDEKMK